MEWFHNKCSGMEDVIHKALNSTQGVKSIYWYCTNCATVRKPIMDKFTEIIMAQKATEQLLTDEIEKREDLERRVTELEKQEKKSDEEIKTYASTTIDNYMKEYPALGDQTKQIEQVRQDQEKNHQELTTSIEKQKEDLEETKRRSLREKNLVLYNVLEDDSETTADLMLADFQKIVDLYSDKVEIKEDDLTAISRLGANRPGQIRPLRITFVQEAKKREVLRNNKDLIMEKEDLKDCTLDCALETKHIHVYVAPDRTEMQRKTDKKLRLELKARKRAGESNIVIRNEKIVPFRAVAQSSWASVHRG